MIGYKMITLGKGCKLTMVFGELCIINLLVLLIFIGDNNNFIHFKSIFVQSQEYTPKLTDYFYIQTNKLH